MTLSEYAPRFDHAEGLYAKSLILVMLPLFAAGAGLVFADRRLPVVAHLVFAIHYYSFLLVALSALFPVLALVLVGLWVRGGSLNPSLLDWICTLLEGALCIVYLAKAVRVFYRTTALRTWIAAGLLTLATMYILYGYRLVLFLVTLWTT